MPEQNSRNTKGIKCWYSTIKTEPTKLSRATQIHRLSAPGKEGSCNSPLFGFSTKAQFLGERECSKQQERFNFRILSPSKIFLKG